MLAYTHKGVLVFLLGSFLAFGSCKDTGRHNPPENHKQDNGAKPEAERASKADTESTVFKGRTLPPSFPKELLLPGAKVYDGLSVPFDKNGRAFSVRYTAMKRLADASETLEKILKAKGYDVKRIDAAPRITLKFSSKPGKGPSGKVHVLPTSKIDEVDVQVLMIK